MRYYGRVPPLRLSRNIEINNRVVLLIVVFEFFMNIIINFLNVLFLKLFFKNEIIQSIYSTKRHISNKNRRPKPTYNQVQINMFLRISPLKFMLFSIFLIRHLLHHRHHHTNKIPQSKVHRILLQVIHHAPCQVKTQVVFANISPQKQIFIHPIAYYESYY